MTTTKTADVEGTLAADLRARRGRRRHRALHLQRAEAAEGLAQIVPRSPVPDRRRHPLPRRDGARRPRGRRPGAAPQPGQPPQARGDQARRRRGAGPRRADPHRRERRFARTRPRTRSTAARRPRRSSSRRRRELAYFAEVGFDDVKISVKASNGAADGRRLPACLGDLRPSAAPRRHRGGPAARRGSSRRRPASPRCSREGIGDTIRLLADRRPGRGGAGRVASSSRRSGCASARASTSSPARRAGAPRSTSSRSRRRAQAALEGRQIPLQVAVMGCVVNGPGEARDADLGIAAGHGKGHLFMQGKIVRVVPEAEMVEALVTEAERIVAEGIEARLAARRRRRRGRGGRRPADPRRAEGRRRESLRGGRRQDPQDPRQPGCRRRQRRRRHPMNAART